jgi:23S rRNA (guanosine2251-2'-O)-methyltransferase
MSSDGYAGKKAFYDRVLTVYGRKPALEALRNEQLNCHTLHLAQSNRDGGIVAELLAAADARGVPVKRHTREALARISRNGRQDQGVALDVLCPGFQPLEDYLATLSALPPQRLLALDGITNPQNVGMIVRSAAAGDIQGLIWSHRGTAAPGPLVIKASAGTLYRAPVLRCASLIEALGQCRDLGMAIFTLDAGARESLFDYHPSGHCIYVLGNETDGVSAEIAAMADREVAIPMANGVESLNVAVTAGLIAYATRMR